MVTEDFLRAVYAYLKPYEQFFHYQVLLNGHLDVSRFKPWVEQVNQYRVVSGSTVLSSGCGSAGDLLAFMQQGAARAHGIEVDYGLARLARLRFNNADFDRSVNIEIYDGLKLPYASGSFDIVFSMHVIEHTQDPAQYLIELCRVLRSGGVIFLDVPNRYYKFEQHTMLPYIHWPSTRVRNIILKVLLSKPVSSRLSSERAYQLATYFDYHIPSAAHLLKVYYSARSNYGLQLAAAYFHSYDGQRVSYRSYPGKYFYKPICTKTTFRLVICKTGLD